MSQHQDKLYQDAADVIVRQFLAELAACTTERERIDKVMELVHGVIRGARKEREHEE